MSATTIRITSLPARTTPRGAVWAAEGFAALLQWSTALIAAVTEQRRRAAEARAAREVMVLATSYADTQPGLASDLRGAAMRMNQD